MCLSSGGWNTFNATGEEPSIPISFRKEKASVDFKGIAARHPDVFGPFRISIRQEFLSCVDGAWSHKPNYNP